MENEISKILEKCRRLKRKHATFYNWHDKQIKESGIVDDFLDPENHKGLHDFVSFSIPSSDPPDAIIYKKNDEEVQLEVTELVNQDAIKSQINNDITYSYECQKWQELKYFEMKLNERIQEKNKKCEKIFNENVHLLLHTDEMWLESSYKKHFDSGVTIQPHRFSKIWLMLSYSPCTKSHKIIQVCKYVKIV